MAFTASVLISVVLNRALKPEGRGEIAAAMNSVSLSVAVSSFSLGKAFLYVFNRPGASPNAVMAAATTVLPLSVVLGALALAILTPWRNSSLGVMLLVIAFGLVVLQLTNDAVTGALRASKVIHTLNVSRVVQQLARLIPAAALFSAGSLTLRRAFWIELAAASLALAILLSVLSRHDSLRPLWSPAVPEAARGLLQYGALYLVFSTLWTMHIKFDVLLLNWWQGHREAGVYATAVSLADLVARVPNLLLFVLSPYLAEVKTGLASAELCARMTRHVVPLFLALGLTAAVAAPLLVPLLYGADFSASVVILQTMLPGTVALGLFMMMASHWVVRGRLWTLIALQGAGLAINLGLNALLIPAAGGRGAAVASVVSYGICTAVLLGLLIREGIPLRDAIWPRHGEIRRLIESAKGIGL